MDASQSQSQPTKMSILTESVQSAGYFVQPPPFSPVGDTIPSATPHAVSVSLPTWKDNVDYEEGDERIKKAMSSGYPRFYIHNLIDQLAHLTTAKFGQPNEFCILLPSLRTATACSDFLLSQSPQPVLSRLAEWSITSSLTPQQAQSNQTEIKARTLIIHACFFQKDNFGVAKQFWQHTGDGISSRFAERCLILLGELESDGTKAVTANGHANGKTNGNHVPAPAPAATESTSISTKSSSSRYGTKGKLFTTSSTTSTSSSTTTSNSTSDSTKIRYSTSRPVHTDASPPNSSINSVASTSTASTPLPIEQEEDILTRYVEERYGRNLDLSLAPLAKTAMRRRLAGVLGDHEASEISQKLGGKQKEERVVEGRGVEGLGEKEVWLYPSGMSAIWHAHQLALKTRVREGGVVGKSVCFGFPYTDTLKILQKWGPGCEFFGHGLLSDLPALRELLSTSVPPILAIFCEFPSNPLLRTPPLKELRKLADDFGAMIVIDETIAGFVNVEVLPGADVVVSSLTKVFSGDSNVMGGSLVINPKSLHYEALFASQTDQYEDNYFDEDAIYMERNSRDFQSRVARENSNAENLCELLMEYRQPGPVATGMIEHASSASRTVSPSSTTTSTPSLTTSIIKEIYYPKYMTPAHYLAHLRPTTSTSTPGYGGLFSLTFTSLLASSTFFDTLACYKGPSLGTNFTIACPYTILAHYTELEWALGWGVEKGLVRVSVGLEEWNVLEGWFRGAVEAAEKAVRGAEERGEKYV